jgi:hypothetical protein
LTGVKNTPPPINPSETTLISLFAVSGTLEIINLHNGSSPGTHKTDIRARVVAVNIQAVGGIIDLLCSDP